jgi:hypothetical protein
MMIVRASNINCLIWLGREEGNICQDIYVSSKTYKVMVYWWKLTRTLKETIVYTKII